MLTSIWPCVGSSILPTWHTILAGNSNASLSVSTSSCNTNPRYVSYHAYCQPKHKHCFILYKVHEFWLRFPPKPRKNILIFYLHGVKVKPEQCVQQLPSRLLSRRLKFSPEIIEKTTQTYTRFSLYLDVSKKTNKKTKESFPPLLWCRNQSAILYLCVFQLLILLLHILLSPSFKLLHFHTYDQNPFRITVLWK